MPGKSAIFTPSSILFRPHQRLPHGLQPVVEAPGTAPGSDELIPTTVYRHSRLAPTVRNIGTKLSAEKPRERKGCANDQQRAYR